MSVVEYRELPTIADQVSIVGYCCGVTRLGQSLSPHCYRYKGGFPRIIQQTPAQVHATGSVPGSRGGKEREGGHEEEREGHYPILANERGGARRTIFNSPKR
ncbi:hypothetical protein J6590_048347 [Homalodisca vitripennis]|nr:hypothetical protein J6590_048347 [Homalodisca vitripennis]